MNKCSVLGCNQDVFKGKHFDTYYENRFLCKGHWIWADWVPEIVHYEEPEEETMLPTYTKVLSDKEYTQQLLCEYIGETCICKLCTPPSEWKRTFGKELN